MLRDFLILVVAGVAANYVVTKWVLRASDDDKTGFITIAPGFGMDDLAAPIAFAILAMVAHAVVPGR